MLIHPDFNVKNDVLNDVMTEKEGLIYNLIKENAEITISKLAEKIGCSKITIDRNIKEALKEKGFIVREGAKKSGKWVILK